VHVLPNLSGKLGDLAFDGVELAESAFNRCRKASACASVKPAAVRLFTVSCVSRALIISRKIYAH
jgi:hypothetical protein